MTDRRIFIGIQTILGIYRVVPWWPSVDLSTIVDEFTGVSRTLDDYLLSKAKSNLMNIANLPVHYSFKMRPVTWMKVESSGPNGSVSYTRVIEDAFGLLLDPKALKNLIIWFSLNKGKRFILAILLILVFGWPLLLIYLIKGKTFWNGKLSIVYNQAGKSRVVAMTNFWIQIGLFPLHKSIFDLLKRLETDGTFDQHAPLRALWQKLPDKYYSYDLSAATDRLPIQLQEQVLSKFIGPYQANLWRNLLSIPFSYNGLPIRYSVGQPMGAYSSWAMLALTHHMIVQSCTEYPNREYAILGDDIVVTSIISDRYLQIMQILGVKISLPKSIISNDFVEFAKKIFSSDGTNYSMIGPGLILSVVKNRLLYSLLISEVFLRNLIPQTEVFSRIKSFKGIKPQMVDFGIYSLFGPRGLISNNLEAAFNGVSWLIFNPLYPTDAIQYSIYNSLITVYLNKHRNSVKDARKNLRLIPSYLWYVSMGKNSLILGIYKFLLLWLSPLPYTLFGTYLSASWAEPKVFFGWRDLDSVLDSLREIQIDNLESPTRKESLDILKLYKDVHFYMKQSLDDLVIIQTSRGPMMM